MSRHVLRITFVWNADFSVASGVRALKEAATGHHSCTLCGIAYHRVRQTSGWQGYKKQLAQQYNAEIREPCRNQLRPKEREAAAGDFPAVLCHTSRGIVKLLGSDEINYCNGQLEPFQQLLNKALDQLVS